ncbi:MAG: ABC transporter ATP-binding protein [Lachnospirales bacterium]
MNVLEVKDLKVNFKTFAGEVQAVRGVNFSLQRGETLAIVGESGSGKSVANKAIMGLLAKNSIVGEESQIIFNDFNENGEITGSFEIQNLKENELQEEIRGNRIAMIFQDPMTSLNPTMTIGKQIMEGILTNDKEKSISKEQAKKEAIELISLVGISNAEQRFKQYPHQLSGGMRQRIVIAIALGCKPDILICDEPTTALDVTIQAQILELIKELKQKISLSIIFITHDLGVVANMADRVAVMYAGKIVELGSADDIFYRPAHPYTWGLLASMPDTEEREDFFYAIPGTPPNLLKPPVGDAFARRSEFALEIDFVEEPPMFKVSDSHYAKTWLLHPQAPKVEMPETLRARIDKLNAKRGANNE